MRHLFILSSVFGVLLILNVSAVFACDLCSVYIANSKLNEQQSDLSLIVSEQFTAIHRLQDDGDYLPSSEAESLSSSVTQLTGRFALLPGTAVQVTLPVLSKQYQRLVAGQIEDGSVFGIGDSSIVVDYAAFRFAESDTLIQWNIQSGVKLPTGSTSHLGDEMSHSVAPTNEHSEHEIVPEAEASPVPANSGAEEPHSGHMMHLNASAKHTHAAISGVHGHDLALGTGSIDYLIGTGLLLEYGRVFSRLGTQYQFRTEGDYDYRMHDSLAWDLALGGYVVLTEQHSVALSGALSGEYKGKDSQNGEAVEDTGINALYWGPELTYTSGSKFFASGNLDLPALVNNTGVQLVADYRLRFSVGVRF